MSTEWITDRLPKAEDAFTGLVICMYFADPIDYKQVELGEPWMSIHKLIAPYVKPKTFSAVWNDTLCKWNIVHRDGLIVATLRIDVEGVSTAQRICDIYNEVMP